VKRIIFLAAVLLPGLAHAQAASVPNVEPTMTMPNHTTFSPSLVGREPLTDTPSVQRQKARRALALREEAAALLEADGGTLTPRHQAYLQRKARNILAGRR
jgi:hypothetical protein